MIKLREINKTYYNGAALHVLKGLNLEIKEGEFVAIMGASGSGKSTLLNIIGILDDYDTGSYHLNSKLIQGLSEKESAIYRNQMIGFVFQSFNLISFKTALENVALPLYYKGIRRSKRNKIAMEYLERMGLGEWADHMPSELSGGQKQRISIARALVANPRVILADEPTGALDSQTSVEVMQLLQQVNREGMTIVMVTHNPEMAAMSQKIINIRDGIIGSVEHNNKTGHV
ncbi:MAG TPA: ABC transporter ATP-binding protein [Bacteroidales bacterium]|nr:MAG: Macrolide export ATP-binding/permease protein MacB [Bacteroidetes bacterium ADurb.Bin139]HOG25829.1 ABC transporter ATP-binding protein [Bacteroidales bacterium]HOR11195.1 ABC transporter ATP-binding protein [Bacteroidales bacterium]HOZ19803.1 ABC transporter ATP-binding protein [Bacteroidales bacterium]HPK39564.1 ABC transporter ATP-binding protein [Bacteroidales bacterium]